MVKSTSLPNGTVVIPPRKRGAAGAGLLLLFLLMLMIGALAIGGLGLFTPTRLATAQEQVLGLIHGGIVDRDEATYVDGCVPTANSNELLAVTRTRRIVSFADGTTLEVVFSARPQPTNACP